MRLEPLTYSQSKNHLRLFFKDLVTVNRSWKTIKSMNSYTFYCICFMLMFFALAILSPFYWGIIVEVESIFLNLICVSLLGIIIAVGFVSANNKNGGYIIKPPHQLKIDSVETYNKIIEMCAENDIRVRYNMGRSDINPITVFLYHEDDYILVKLQCI